MEYLVPFLHGILEANTTFPASARRISVEESFMRPSGSENKRESSLRPLAASERQRALARRKGGRGRSQLRFAVP